MIREKLFAAYKTREKPLAVPTPEWPELDGQVFVRKLTAGELDKFYAGDNQGNERARFVALVACDENNERQFKDSDVSDIAELPFDVIDRIAYKGQWFNKMLSDQREEMQKN